MVESKITVLHIFTSLPVGGAEMNLLNIVRNIDREKFHIVVCCLGKEGEIGERIKDLGVELVSLGAGRIGTLNVPLLLRLRSFIKKKKFDIVHTHMYHANLYGRTAAWLAGSPVIIAHIHNIYQKRKLHRIVINRLLSNITDRVITGNRIVMKDVISFDRVPENMIEVLAWGIDTELFTKEQNRTANREAMGFRSDDYVIGNVARLEEAKGQRYLIKAVRTMKELGLNVRCLIIGSGSLEKELKSLALESRVAGDILFLGTRHDLPQLFSAMDAFVLPSLWEGLPLALLSAMASGLAVITTDVGGIKDVIIDGVNGLIIPQSDPQAIADAVGRIYRDRGLAAKMSERSRQEAIVNYSARALTKRLEEIYIGLLGQAEGEIINA